MRSEEKEKSRYEVCIKKKHTATTNREKKEKNWSRVIESGRRGGEKESGSFRNRSILKVTTGQYAG